MISIISISKEESLYIREHNPAIQQTIVNRHAPSRKKGWLVPEEGRVYDLLDAYRREHVRVIESHGKVGGRRG